MPQLCLLRHAKSDWFGGASGDFDRPISARGRRDAPLIAARMRDAGLRPQRILCSPATRARQTFDAIAGHLPATCEVSYPAELYDAGNGDYVATIRAHAGNAGSLLVIGHNPMIHETALCLVDPASAGPVETLVKKFPTSALAVLEFDVPWSDIALHAGHLAAFHRPADLRSA